MKVIVTGMPKSGKNTLLTRFRINYKDSIDSFVQPYYIDKKKVIVKNNKKPVLKVGSFNRSETNGIKVLKQSFQFEKNNLELHILSHQRDEIKNIKKIYNNTKVAIFLYELQETNEVNEKGIIQITPILLNYSELKPEIEKIRNICGNIPIILCGNKTDNVTDKDSCGIKFPSVLTDENIYFCKISALNNENIDVLLNLLNKLFV